VHVAIDPIVQDPAASFGSVTLPCPRFREHLGRIVNFTSARIFRFRMHWNRSELLAADNSGIQIQGAPFSKVGHAGQFNFAKLAPPSLLRFHALKLNNELHFL